MKIALVSPYDFSYPGGVVNHISCQAHQLTKIGHEVKIIAPASKVVPAFGDRFIQVGKPRPVPASGSIARITISPWLDSYVRAILNREKFDIFHLHEPLVPTLCTTVLRLSQAPVIGTFHASGGKSWNTYSTPITKFFLRKWLLKIDGRIAVSQSALRYVQRHFQGDYSIIPNGIDSKHFYPDVSPFDNFTDGKINILFVGRLESRKGVKYLIDAYKLVAQEIPDIRLIIVGPGTRLRKKYEKHVSKNHLKNVIFIGYAAYNDLPRYFKTADIVCAPATGWESFGIVLLEAMAVGKPIIASNIEGYASVLNHGIEGLLVPPKNTKKLAGALSTLINDKKLRQKMGAKGRLKAIEYDWEHITEQVLNIYHKTLKESPRKNNGEGKNIPEKTNANVS